MKIALAQIKSSKGDVAANIAKHKAFIQSAIEAGTDLIVFPELSITGYEPSLAAKLAIDPDDSQLESFQSLSDAHQIVIGVGAPTKSEDGICISLLLFQPHLPRKIYSKRYLHVDEEPYFVSGSNFPIVKLNDVKVAFAICYEISVAEHATCANKEGAEIYIASVAKHMDGIKGASNRLSEIARTYSIPVLLSNCVGPSDNFVGAGMSGVWDSSGHLLEQLNDVEEGLLFYDMAR